MPAKNKKDNQTEPVDVIGSVVKILQNSAVTIFWESVDRFKKEVKLRVDIGFQYLLGVLAILTGLIFALIGIANFLEDVVGIRGVGYILVGIFVTVGGIWVSEKAKVRNNSLANRHKQ